MPECDEALMGFDFGVKKIGVAVGNTVTGRARPVGILRPDTRAARFEAVQKLLHEWQPARLVVGLPLTESGEEQLTTRQCRHFADQLRGRFGLPVELVDERGSSLEAQRITGAQDDDAVAAAIILQRYLDGLTHRV